MRSVALLSAAALFGLTATAVRADVIYDYSGQDFYRLFPQYGEPYPYSTSDSVSGYIVLSAPLSDNLDGPVTVVPISFSFTDGVDTITNLDDDPTLTAFQFDTDGIGNIFAWRDTVVSLSDAVEIASDNIGYSQYDQANAGPIGSAWTGATGTWSGPLQTPLADVREPSTLAILGIGLAGLAGIRRRRAAA